MSVITKSGNDLTKTLTTPEMYGILTTANALYSTGGYSDFATILTTIGANNGTILVDSAVTIAADTTIPANVSVQVIKSGSFAVDTDKTLTINGSFSCGLFQCFSGAGSVVFGAGAVSEVYPEWWGTNTIPGTTDMTHAVQAATDSLPNGGVIKFLPAVYLFKGSSSRATDGVKLASNITYQGTDCNTEIRRDATCFNAFSTKLFAAITDISQAPKNISFRGIKFTMPGVAFSTGMENTAALYIGAVYNMTVQNCIFYGWPGDAITLGINDDSGLTTILQTYVRDVFISENIFDGINKSNRQAVSILCGQNIHITNNDIKNTTELTMPGAIDIEPIPPMASWAVTSDIYISNNSFTDIGGSTGIVSLASGANLTYPVKNLFILNNVFSGNSVTATSDIMILGRSSTNHTAITSDCPYNITISGNRHNVPTTRPWVLGGAWNIEISYEIVNGSGPAVSGNQALFGYSAGETAYPIANLNFTHNCMTNWVIPGNIYAAPLAFYGGVLNGNIGYNSFVDCGNSSSGTPGNATVVSISGNGLFSTNISMCNNSVIIRSFAFSTYSFPLYAGTLTNPSTFIAKNNIFVGMTSDAYNSGYSIYSQIPCDTYSGWVNGPDSATPSVAGSRCFIHGSYSAITNLTNGQNGQIVTLSPLYNSVAVINNSNILLNGSANFTMKTTDTLTLVNRSGVWYEVSRSVH